MFIIITTKSLKLLIESRYIQIYSLTVKINRKNQVSSKHVLLPSNVAFRTVRLLYVCCNLERAWEQLLTGLMVSHT